MKKILAFSFSLLFCLGLFAQQAAGSANELKNFRFGGTILPSIDWYTPSNLQQFSGHGPVFKFGVLINGEYSFSKNFAFGFGIGLASSGGKINFTGASGNDTARYYLNSDGAIIKQSDTVHGKFSQYKLNNRTYSASYFIIPLSLKMRTNEIGYMRYFFQPSLNIGIRKKVLANDDLTPFPAEWPKSSSASATSVNQPNLDITSDMSLIRLSATISAGGEYYISGSTAIVFSIGYDYGLTNVVKSSSAYLIRADNSAVSQNFTQNGVVLTVGVLF